MRINYTILKDLLRKSAVIVIVLALVQVLYISEQPVIPVLCEKLTQRFPDVCFRVSRKHGAAIRFA